MYTPLQSLPGPSTSYEARVLREREVAEQLPHPCRAHFEATRRRQELGSRCGKCQSLLAEAGGDVGAEELPAVGAAAPADAGGIVESPHCLHVLKRSVHWLESLVIPPHRCLRGVRGSGGRRHH